MKESDIIKCQPGTEHWHSSSKEQDVTYLAIYGGTTPTEWTEELTREAPMMRWRRNWLLQHNTIEHDLGVVIALVKEIDSSVAKRGHI